jgi:hypothetical protein
VLFIYLPDSFKGLDADAHKAGAGERGKREKERFHTVFSLEYPLSSAFFRVLSKRVG